MHRYQLTLEWTGNLGPGTSGYRTYSRDSVISAVGKPDVPGSSDPAFRGDAGRWNPEELLVAALSECHLLAYLHLAATAGVVVTAYRDEPVGEMSLNPDGSGQFTSVVLHPRVSVAADEMTEAAQSLHARAHEMCFIARSVAFPVGCEPVADVADTGKDVADTGEDGAGEGVADTGRSDPVAKSEPA